LTAEKAFKPTTVQHQAASGTFFRKAEEPGFFGGHDQASFFSAAHIQPKLTVSQPDDPQEKEADAMADHVMRMPEPAAATGAIQPQEEGAALMRLLNAAEAPILAPTDDDKKKLHRKEEDEHESTAHVQPMIMRQCAACAHEEHVQGKLMRMSADEQDHGLTGSMNESASGISHIAPKAHSPPAGSLIQRSGRAPPASHHSFETSLQDTKGGGMPLPADTRQSMEHRFGADFSNVRIHTGAQAASLSADIHAHAFTHGGDIYFNSGKFSPDTASGSRLLAHELTHTIQQGASRHVPGSDTSVAPKLQSPYTGSRSGSLQRVAAERPAPPQLASAVAKAKGEEGKVNANKEGPDGFRTGWEHLIDYFKTTLGPDKVLGAGGSYKQGAVAEQDIKKKREITGALAPAHPAVERKGPYKRDAMPSWCGIFVFWALHKAGVPMKPWELGGRNITPDAAFPPGHTPQAGDIAYRNNFSHFAIVEKASGNTITTVNGNTTGEDNLGGQVQTRDHQRSDWDAFFDPLLLKNGPLTSGETTAEAVKPLSIQELRKKVFHVDRKTDTSEEELKAEESSGAEHAEAGEKVVQAKPELSHWSVDASGTLQRNASPAEEEQLQKKEDDRQEEEKIGGLHEPAIQKKGTGGFETANETASQHASAQGMHASSSSSILPLHHATYQPGIPALNPKLQTNKGPPGIIQRSWLGDAWDAVSGAVNSAVQWAEDQINEAKEWILGQIRDFVSNIPGYRMLTVILQEDPITSQPVARNGTNLLLAGLQILGPLGTVIETLLRRTNTFADAANFVEARVGDFASMASSIAGRFSHFIDGLSITDIGHPQQVLDDVAALLHGVITDITGFIERTTTDFLDMVKRVMIREVVGFVRNRIPRLYPLLTVVLGHDPVTNQDVPRNGTTILNALFEVTDEGREQRKQLQETGTFQKAAAWIDRGIHVFSNLYTAIRSGFSLVWDAVSFETLLHPIETFQRIYDHFAQPVADVWAFVRDTARIILDFIKEALLARLSAWAREQRGYFLITLLIHRDPFTGATVPFTIENVIHAFMSLMEGGEQQFQQMKESGAIDRTTNRIMAAVRRLNFTVEYIVGLFTGLWRSFHLSDLADPIGVFRRIIGTFAQPVRRLVAFVIEIIKIVVEVILQIMQFPTDLIANILARAMAAWERIKRDPIGFLKNLLRAIKQGFVQFFDNILDHLLYGLTGWLMSELRDAGVPELTDFSLRGVISWVLQVLGISMEAVWQKLAQHPRIGPEKVARIRRVINTLEGIWTFIKDVQERGIAAIWDKIQEQLSNLWNTILDAVKNWIMEQIVNRIVARLLSMLDPTGIMAVINSAIALYRAIQSFIRYLRQILEVVNSFVTGLADIANGNITTAANYLEQTMRRAMPVVIGFLANQVGLSGIGHRVGEMIVRARQLVDEAMTWLVNKAVDTAFNLLDRLLGRNQEQPQQPNAPQQTHNLPDADVPVPFAMGEEQHEVRFTSTGGVVQITMSSELRIVLPMYLTNAIAQVRAMPNFPGKTRIRQDLEFALRQVDDNGVARIVQDWNTNNVDGTRARNLPDFIREKMLRVVENLSDLAIGDRKIPAIVGLYDLLNKNTRMPGPYAGTPDPADVVPFGEFSSSQKRAILNQNMANHGGVLMSDCVPGEVLHDLDPNDPLKANVDHIYPRAKGGSNSYSNAQVISRQDNIRKSDTKEGCP
jgi:phage-related protein